MIRSRLDHCKLQVYLNKLVEWADKWQMSVNVDKCKILHVGSSNNHFDYSIKLQLLEKVKEENDVGVKVSCELKSSKHCHVYN